LDFNGFNVTLGSISGGGNLGGSISLGSSTLTAGGDNTSTTYASNLSGSGGLTKVGSGTLTLSGTNGYVGATRVSGGTLQAGSSSAFGNASAVSLDDAAGVALDLNNQATTIGSLAGGGTAGGHINLGSATLTTGSLDATTRYAGVISGSGGLTQTGAGTLTLTGTNNYTGATTIAAGSTLQIGDGSTDGSIATSNGISNDGALIFNLGSDQTNAFGISGTGTLSKSGAGTLTLSGTNGYTGATTISGGTLAINTAAALGSTAGVNLGNAATLRYTGSASATLDRDLAVTAGTGFLRNSGPGTLTLSGTLSKNGTTLTFAEGLFAVTGSIVGASANSDLVVDAASVILGGANSYTGPTYLRNGASLTANLAGALPTTTRSALVMDDSGTGSSTLSLGADQVAASLSGAATSVVGLGSHTLTVGETGGTSSFAGTLGGSGGRLTKDGSSTLILSGANTYTGATTVGGGTLQAGAVNALSATSAVTLANATGANLALNNFSQTIGSLAGGGSNGGNVSLGSATLTTGGNASSTSYAGVISGSGGFTKTGAGTQTLSGANTYTGTTTVAAGTLALLANSGAALANTSTLVLASGATVSLGAAQQINAAANLTLAGGTLILNGFNQTLGTLDLNANAALNLGGSAELVFADSHGLDWNSAQLNVSNFTIGTTKLRFGTSNAGLTAVQLGLIRFVSFDNAAAQIDANGFLAPVPANFENASSTDSLIATPIAGTTAVSQTGQGTTTLTAAGNTSTGLASVTAGTLVIGTEAGGNWAGDVIVSGTGTLKGRGTITGSVRVESGGNYSPGNSPAIQLILTDLILDSGSRVTLELDGASAGYGAFFHDKSVVSGVVTLNGTLSASTIFSGSNGYVPAFGASHTVITGRELTGRFAAYDFAANATGVSWLPEYTATAVNLYAVPDNYATLSGLNPNQTRIGVALQSLRNAGPFELDQRAALSSRATLFNGLKTKDAAGLRSAYDQLTPEKLIALASATFQSASIQQANVQQRSAELRRFGPGAVSLNGVARPAAAEDYQVKTVIEDGVQYAVAQVQAPRRLGYFASATGAFAAVDASAERLGSFAQTGAGSFGCDYALNPNQELGLIVSQSFTDTDFSGASGSARTTTNRLGVFHAYHHQGFFLTTSGSVGFSDYATKRNLLFLNQTASGETQGFSYGAQVAAGYEFKVGDYIMGPTASIAYDHAQVAGFNETGSAADLQLSQQNSNSLLTQAGFRVSRPLRWKNIGWVPALSLGASRQLFNPNTITAQLAAGGTPFSVKPQAGGHAYINPGASLEAIMANGFTLRLSYEAIVNKDSAEHRVNFSVGAGF
jgi:autotransporter-associated beta strand protein